MSFKEKVIYQIYPKSFYDFNNDGIGELIGITKKLPYLQSLGIDMIWISPFYPSPQNDNGYDISDYCAVDPRFGTMNDFENLIHTAKDYGIEVMLDMVFNHVSTEHQWFKKALAGEKKYQEYFILRDQPTDWLSKFGGNAWGPFGTTGKYYLHLFDKTQADLNWRNEEVRKEIQNVVKFWMNKGVKGFRFDVINLIGKDIVLQNNKENDGKLEYTDRPITHKYLNELNHTTFGRDASIVTVGEMSFTTIESCLLYTQPEREEMNMAFQFHHLKVDYENGQKWTDIPFDFTQLKQILNDWQTSMSDGNGWSALFWNNHDQPRALSRFIDTKNYRSKGAQMLAASIHLSRGTPYIYMGEEIGMLDPEYDTIEEYQDIEARNAYKHLIDQGYTKQQAFYLVSKKSRDNARTPMQWDANEQAGFTKGTPWLKVGKSYQEINVQQECTKGEIFSFYQKLIQLRKTYSVISEGTYRAYQPDHPAIYGYVRTYEKQELLVLTNFYNQATTITIDDSFLDGEILIGNYMPRKLTKEIHLEPYEVLAIYKS